MQSHLRICQNLHLMMSLAIGLRVLFNFKMFFRKKIVKGLNKTFLNIKIFLKKFIYFDSELTKDLFFIIEKLNFKTFE